MEAPNDSIESFQGGIPFKSALRYWLKLGFISFGGPAGQISIMHEELVVRKRWISEQRFLHALNYCMILPGPEAQQLASYMGWLMHGTLGGIVAGTLFVLPSFILLIFLSWVYIRFGELAAIAGLFVGIKPAVTAIVAHAAFRIGKRVLKNWILFFIALASLCAIVLFKVPFPCILFVAALLGFVLGKLRPDTIMPVEQHTLADAEYTSNSERDFFSRRLFVRRTGLRLWLTTTVGLLCWLLPMLFLHFVLGPGSVDTQMAWFFSKAALLTFGGAYAVLPYVYQGAVVHYTWLSPQQMIDGLGLGEATPGPLIMIVTFVGFVGGYQSTTDSASMFILGLQTATVATWFTFLPSFLFILIGAPLVEASRHKVTLSAPLTAVTAAVSGVIVNLFLFFAYHTFWPTGLQSKVDIVAVLLSIMSAVLLFRFKQSVIRVIVLNALIGLALQFIC